VVTWLIVPVGVLLVISQLRSNASFPAAMVGSVAGVTSSPSVSAVWRRWRCCWSCGPSPRASQKPLVA
jgi:hypothetical protein